MAGKQDDLEIVIGADLSGLASDLAKTRSMFSGLAKDIERIAPRTSDFAPPIATAGFERLSRVASGAGLSVRSLASELVGFGAKMAVAGGSLIALEAGLNGISGAFEQLKGSVVMAAEFEQNQIAFETMLGSAKDAARVMADLRKFAADTPFGSKEVTQSARQLLAFGTAADDLIPTLKTLGTISAAYGTPLKDEVYRWGTVKVAGRAMQQDINQYTTAGINVVPGIAKSLKTDASQVRKFTEDSRVSADVLSDSLEDLARNKFGGMLARQADSLKGSWEQLTDAFDRAKLKLGQVIAQEAGLRGASKDLEAFAGRMERALDSERFRGAVRFVGDLVKGGAQLAHEFGRAAIEIGRINLEGLENTSPQFNRLVTDIKTFVAGIQDFKFDRRALVSAGLTVFEAIADPMARLIDYADKEGRDFGDAIKRNFVQPFKDIEFAAKSAEAWWQDSWLAKAKRGVNDTDDWIARQTLGREGWEQQRKILEQADVDRAYLRDRFIDRPVSFKSQFPAVQITKGRDNQYEAGLRAMADVVRFGDPKEQLNHHFYAPKDWEPKEQVWRRYDLLRQQITNAEKLIKEDNLTQLEPHLKELQKKESEFLAPYATPQWGMDYARGRMNESRRAGQLPPRRDEYVEPPPPSLLSHREALRDRVADFKQGWLAQEDIREHFGKMFGAIRAGEANAATARTVGTPFGLAALGPFGNVARELSGLKKDDLYLPRSNQVPAHLMELATKLNEQYAGVGLDAKLNDLKSLLDKGLISNGVYGKARDASVREVADRLGLNQPSRLPDTVLAGSQEDARLLAQAMGGQQQKGVEDLLKLIEQHLSAIRTSNKNIETAPAPRPVNVAVGNH